MLIVLTKILPFFPVIDTMGESLHRTVTAFVKNESRREDLKILGTGYLAMLSKRKANWVTAVVFQRTEVTASPALAVAASPVVAAVSSAKSSVTGIDSPASEPSTPARSSS